MKRIVKEYLSFTRKERTAIVILLVLMGLFIAAPYLYTPEQLPPVDTRELESYLERQPAATRNASGKDATVGDGKATIARLFLFDPNTLSAEGWQQLGIRERTALTILRYRSKGGRFRRAEDLRKIWGLATADADRLIPYVRIPDGEQPKTPTAKAEWSGGKWSLQATIRINDATVDDWQALPGIGEVLANRIVRYRDKLGGFTSVEQVGKTYGISDSVFQRIQPLLRLDAGGQPANTRLDLNIASAPQLSAHTGIPEAIARAIVVYRKQYGPFRTVADLKKIVVLSDSLFQLIEPFVHVK